MPVPRKHVSLAAGLGLVASVLLIAPSPAQAVSTGLVISEVYGAGGNSGAVFNADFVELYNPTGADVPLTDLAIQYRSSTGSGTTQLALDGIVAAGDTYVIQMSAPGSNGAPLAADATTSAFTMSASDGQVLLKTSTAAFSGSGNLAGNAALVDMVGYGDTTTSFEGNRTGVDTTSLTSAQRDDAGADTDNNAADFVEQGPTPGFLPAGATIAEIQGTTDASPLVGTVVSTSGVVTGRYGRGGLDGFYVQTPGTPETPGASDAVFVYAPDLPQFGYPTLGASVTLVGEVTEFFGLTEVELVGGPGVSGLSEVTPLSVPWSDLDSDAEKEAHEGELVDPQGPFTVTDSYNIDNFGEIGLASGTKPLVVPTEVEDFQTGDVAAVAADNLARAITLDDGAAINFRDAGSTDTPYPWLTPTNPVRVGAPVTFPGNVVLDYRNSTWKFQPVRQVTGAGAGVATFENTRTSAPEAVGGDIRLATFNVLNYFPTTGVEFAGLNPANTCTYFRDRDGQRTTVQSCNPSGPRGAADPANLARQQAKIVKAINALDASVVSLEELENSAKFGKDRDFAISTLVSALNAEAGPGTWAFAPSPAAADRPTVAQEDVIRTGFIYKPADVRLVGASKILIDEVNFDNAREPLAQAFKAVGAPNRSAFAVIVNHFKSKGSPGSGGNADLGQGGWNADRIGQAQALNTFATSFANERNLQAVFLAGDFNSYTKEDPMQVLYEAGYTNLKSTTTPGEASYSFDGLSGSLDHVVANPAALALVTGVDIWNINAEEAVAYEYSRYNSNETMLFDGSQPYKASDHNPEVVGLNLAPANDGVSDVNLLNINDFHGRIDANTTKFATTVEQLRDAEGEGNTLFLSAGDNIGASLFASAIQDDEPAIDVLNALDLATSAAGNHEFDRGFADLQGRVLDRADFTILGANVYQKGTTTPALDEYDLFEVDGVTVGVIGAITEETPALVSPAGISELEFGDPVVAVNRVAGQLTDGNEANGEADVLVAEYHDGAGAGTPDGATLQQELADGGAFAAIVNDTSAEVDAIFTGHTHKEYAWDAPVPGEAGKTRPVLQTGSYGERIGQIKLTVDTATGDVTAYTQRNVARATTADLSYPRVAEVKRITDAALAFAAEVGNQPVGNITADITTAFSGGSYVDGKYVGGSRDNRAAESSLGGLVANALRDGVSDFAAPDLGLTNPGGMRAELLYQGNTAGNPLNTDGVVTFAEANGVLPFNNTVAIVQLTGAELEAVLEQQWQTNPDGTIPSRPYLQLGLSDNVEVTADATKPAGSRITSVRISGEPLDPEETYTISTLSFLATGGDNFRAFTDGTYTDTGLLDAQLWRDYLAESSPISPDFARQQVFESGMPQSVAAGDEVSLTLGAAYTAPVQPITGAKLDLTSLGSPANTVVTATGFSGGQQFDLGAFGVTDGIAPVSFTVPAGMTEDGRIELVASPSGTTVTIPVIGTPKAVSTTVATATPGTVTVTQDTSDIAVSVTAGGGAATGEVVVLDGETELGRATLTEGSAVITVGPFDQAGTRNLTVRYLGNGTTDASETTAAVVVAKATPTLESDHAPNRVIVDETRARVTVKVYSGEIIGTGTITFKRHGEVLATKTLTETGEASVLLSRFATVGEKNVRIIYSGDDLLKAAEKVHTIRVVRR